VKISPATIDILKNFSEINQSIVIKEGKTIKTVNSLKNILAHAEVKEQFPKEFAIYDLNEFIGLLSTMSEPELSFNDNYVAVSSGKRKVKYRYADPSYIVKPEKELSMPEGEIKFTLKEDVYVNLTKSATILQLHDVYLKGCDKSNKMFLCATNKKNDSSNDYSEEVGEGVPKKFNVVIKKENLKIVPGDYYVSISSQGISHFKNTKSDLEYWIALEPTSDYGE
tara:strand:+ start:122 stop:793 length:672 start_codon:yes stop_codon:yes gene_type:complete